MNERQPKRRADWLVRGALIGAVALGGNFAYQHEQGQTKQIESLQQENKRIYDKLQGQTFGNPNISPELASELSLIWVAICRDQSNIDNMLFGETDVTQDEAGLKVCRGWAQQWHDGIFKVGK